MSRLEIDEAGIAAVSASGTSPQQKSLPIRTENDRRAIPTKGVPCFECFGMEGAGLCIPYFRRIVGGRKDQSPAIRAKGEITARI